MSEGQKALTVTQQQQKIIDDMRDSLRQIGDFAEGLKTLLANMLDGTSEVMIVDLTLNKIIELVDQNI